MQIIILGMHRSGTSCVTRLVNMMGAYYSSQEQEMYSQPDNPKGFWERTDVMRLNNEILHSAGGTWDLVAELDFNKISQEKNTNFQNRIQAIVKEMNEHRPWLLKDPRMCLLLSYWLPFLDSPVFLFCYRSPLQIANSLLKRNNIPLFVGIALWEYYTISALNMIGDAKLIITGFEDVLNAPLLAVKVLKGNLHELGVEGLSLPNEKEVTSFVTPKLFHNRSDSSSWPHYLNKKQLKLINIMEHNSHSNSFSNLKVSKNSIDILQNYFLTHKKKLQLQKSLAESQQLRKQLEKSLSAVEKDRDHTQHLLNVTRGKLKKSHINRITLQHATKRHDELRLGLAFLRKSTFGDLALFTKLGIRFCKIPGLRNILEKAKYKVHASRIDKIAKQLASSGLFDEDYYLSHNPDVAKEGGYPLKHFVAHGVFKGLRPNELFDPVYYLKMNTHIISAGYNPLLHYHEHGWKKRRDPSPEFSTSFYLDTYKDVALATINPLLHYMRVGKNEGRLTHSNKLPELLSRVLDSNPTPTEKLAFEIEQLDRNGVVGRIIAPKGNHTTLEFFALIDKETVVKAMTNIAEDDINRTYGNGDILANFNLLFPNKIKDDTEHNIALFARIDSSYLLISVKDVYFSDTFSELKRKNIDTLNTVVFCTHNLKSQGAQNSLFELATGLKRRGKIYPIVISAQKGGYLKEQYEKNKISVLIKSPLLNVCNFVEWEIELFSLCSYLRKLSPAAVIANTLQNFYWILAAHKIGIPTIFIPRESEDPRTYFNYLPKFLRGAAENSLSVADRVVFVAESTRKGWEYMEDKKNFTVINNALNVSRIEERSVNSSREYIRKSFNIEKDEIVLLSLGTVSKRKGQLDLVKALPQIFANSKKPIKVFIVGMADGPKGSEIYEYKKSVLEAVNNLPPELKTRITLYPETDSCVGVSVNDFYTSADIFVFTSRVESYPRVILEAMFFGLPIVTTPCFGVKEQCVDGVNSYFYEEGDIEVLAAKVTNLINDDEKRSGFASGSKHLFSHFRSYEMMLDQYQKELIDIMVK